MNLQVYDPQRRRCLDISLFERLVNGRLPVQQLLVSYQAAAQLLPCLFWPRTAWKEHCIECNATNTLCLQVQRRMQPAISALIRQELYPRLQDGPNVFQYPPISGLACRHQACIVPLRPVLHGMHGHSCITPHWQLSPRCYNHVDT